MEVISRLKGANISAQKARLVANQIRGMNVENAILLLSFSKKKAACLIKKVLNSAVANAEHNEGLDIDELYISSIMIDKGVTVKRIFPRAKGRADRIFKRSCHIFLKIANNE